MTTNYSGPRSIPEDLRNFDMTFTVTGLAILKAHRDVMSFEQGRKITLAKALDAILKACPTAAKVRVQG
jgi:hypothetical protein